MLAPTATTINGTAPQGRKRLQRRVLLADPSQEYFVHVPASCGDHAPLVVAIHGQSRNADEQARLLAATSEAYGAILVAPIFAAEQHPDYQRLGRLGRGKRADIALNLIVAEVGGITGAAAERFFLFGFSGGAQFAHRYAMTNPHRVAGAVIASAGWYTFPDAARRYPYGTRMNRRHPGVRFDAEEFLHVPFTVIVGKDDDSQVGLRHSGKLDREQGTTRVERARRWVAAMQAAAVAHNLESRVSYEEVENCSHSLRRSILRGDLADRVFKALLGAPPASTH